jgi:hypothetical protein
MTVGFRAGAGGVATWRVCTLLLAAGLISLATLAKHSFVLPRASGCHWISQACKIRETRRAAPTRTIAVPAAVPFLRCDQPAAPVRLIRKSDTAVRVFYFFSNTALRPPPLCV